METDKTDKTEQNKKQVFHDTIKTDKTKRTEVRPTV